VAFSKDKLTRHSISNCRPQPPLFVQRPRRNHPNYIRECEFEYSNHKNSDHTYPVHHNHQLHHGLWLRQANGLPCTFLSRRHHNLDSALYLSLARRNRHHDHLLRLCGLRSDIHEHSPSDVRVVTLMPNCYRDGATTMSSCYHCRMHNTRLRTDQYASDTLRMHRDPNCE
jgi:hypothetical protein